jgi:GT2 family glycosyltransferase
MLYEDSLLPSHRHRELPQLWLKAHLRFVLYYVVRVSIRFWKSYKSHTFADSLIAEPSLVPLLPSWTFYAP